MSKNKKNGLLANAKPNAIKGIEKKSMGNGGGGQSILVLKYLLEIDDTERKNGLTAKAIANGIAKLYGVAFRDSKVRGFFRDNFNVGLEKEDKDGKTKYVAYNEATIGGVEYFAHATQVGVMEYTLLTSIDEINDFGS